MEPDPSGRAIRDQYLGERQEPLVDRDRFRSAHAIGAQVGTPWNVIAVTYTDVQWRAILEKNEEQS